MANKNYDQVALLLAQSKLNWASDSIVGLLMEGCTFVGSHKKSSELDGRRWAVAPVQQKVLLDTGEALGLPLIFSKIPKDIAFQVVLAQDNGTNDPSVLAFIDTNAFDDLLQVQRTGTLIVRPVLPQDPPASAAPTIGVWMNLGA